ncbi:MAG: hypothetical protein H7836_04410 [Magnetococcus sp. YQC-3]
MHLKLDRNGLSAAGFNGERGVDYVDEGNVLFGELSKSSSRVRSRIQATQKNQAAKRKADSEYRKEKAEREKIKKEQKEIKRQKQQAKRVKEHNQKFSKTFLKAKRQRPMGYDFTSLMGSPFEGFGSDGEVIDGNMLGEGLDQMIGDGDSWGNGLSGGFKIKAPKISAPKISAPKISAPKISAPKIKAPKIKAPKIRAPTLKQVGSGVSKSLKSTVSTVAKVAAAPVAAGAHVLKQAGGHKLESGLKAATGVSVTQMARGGDATIAQAGKAVGAALSAPTLLADKAVKQIGGHKLVNALDRMTGGTYTQAVNVGTLPGRALAGQAISKKDWVEVASLAMKVAAVVSAGSLAGAAVMMCKQYAAKELSSKLGGSAGSILAGVSALSSGDVSGAVTTMAQEEAKRQALAEATKKLGPDAGSILAIGSAAYTGGAGKATDVATDIGKQKAMAEVAKKTGLPMGVITAVQSGKVPTPSEVKDSMKRELLAAPDKLQAEMKKIPELIKSAPENAKAALVQKQELIKSELANRDKIVANLTEKHSQELKKADEKIKAALDKTNLQAKITDEATAKATSATKAYDEAVKDPKQILKVPELAKKKEEAIKTQNKEAEKLAKLDAETSMSVAEKENMDNVYQAKEFSASNGLYGVRTSDKGTVLADYKDVLPSSVADEAAHAHPALAVASPETPLVSKPDAEAPTKVAATPSKVSSTDIEHPFISAGLIPRKG